MTTIQIAILSAIIIAAAGLILYSHFRKSEQPPKPNTKEITDALWKAWEEMETVRILGTNLPQTALQESVNSEVEEVQFNISQITEYYHIMRQKQTIRKIQTDITEQFPEDNYKTPRNTVVQRSSTKHGINIGLPNDIRSTESYTSNH